MPKQPFAFLLSNGRIVHKSALDGYAMKEGSHAIPPDRFAAQYGTMSIVEPIYNPEALARLLEINTFHARCVYTKATDIVGLGWSLTAKVDEPSEEQRIKALSFFKNNVDDITFDDMLFKLAVDYLSTGMAFMEVVRVNDDPSGEIELLAHLPAHTMRVHKSNDKYVQQRNALKVWFKKFGYDKDVNLNTGEENEPGKMSPDLRASEVIVFKIYNSRSDYYGLAPIIPALGAVTGMQGLRDFNLNFFDTFGVPAYAIYITGDYELGSRIDDAGVTEGAVGYNATTGEYQVIRSIKQHLESIHDNPHSPLILAIPTTEGGGGKVEIHFERLAADIKEASFRLYRSDTKDEILVAHGIPPYRIGIAETGSLGGSTAVESTEIYKTSTIRPGQRIFATLINEMILQDGLQITDWDFYFEEIDTTDEEHDVKVAEFLFVNGAITPNQLIQYFGRRFVGKKIDAPEGDYHYMPATYKALETGKVGDQAMLDAVKELHDRLFNIAIKDRAAK